MRTGRYATIAILLLFVMISPAEAYIGPGAGVTAIGSFIALVVAIIAAIFGFLWYPIKRLLRRRSPQIDEGESAEQ